MTSVLTLIRALTGKIGFYRVYLNIMKLWENIFRVIILIMGIVVIVYNAQLFIYCKEQRTQLSSIRDKQDIEAEFNSNKFKYQQDQIERISKDLEDARQQIKGQKDALSGQKDALADQKDSLLQEIQKRQQVENEAKGLQTSLVDIKAEADAIKQDMKGWQKDYVGVLAQLDKGIDNIQEQIKGLHDNLNSYNIPDLNQKISSLQSQVDKIAQSPAVTSISPAPEQKIEHEHFKSQ